MTPLRLFLALALLLPGLRADDAPKATQADVIVYGATPGGFCAAIAAAREGASVLLLEPTGHVGGMNTGGLSAGDSHRTARATLGGLFREWHRRIAADYATRGLKPPFAADGDDRAVWAYEPHVAARVTEAMLKEAGVRVLTKQRLVSAESEGRRLTHLVTEQGSFSAKVFVDATYEGDLMASAGIYWSLGREGRAEYDESLAGRQYGAPWLRLEAFDPNGVPLPLISSIDPGIDAEAERSVMVYGFRLCVTKDTANRVAFPAPANYDPARFELVRRFFKASGDQGLPWELHPLPGGKFDIGDSAGAFFSMGLVGGANGWCSADAAARAKILEEHRQYALEFYRFLTTDEAVPERIRREMASFGLCRDEFTDQGNWPPQLYVREGRRMQGRFMLSQKDVLVERTKPDPIAISSFPLSSPDCRRVASKEGLRNEGALAPVLAPGQAHGHPFQVPYRSITPAADECTNLLVPVAISATHVAYASLRAEPTRMVIGESAGIAAALAAKAGVTVQALDYAKLRERLLARQQVLDLPAEPAPAKAPAGKAE